MRDEHMDRMVDEYRHTYSGVPGGGRRVFMWANGPMEEMNHYTHLLAHYMSDPAKRGAIPTGLRPARTATGVSVHQTHAITADDQPIRIQVRERE